MYESTRPDGFTVINGRHTQRGTNRRIVYSAWYELVGTRLCITASVRYGDRMLASPDLEEDYRPEAGSEEDSVVAALVRYMDATTFDFGVESVHLEKAEEVSERSSARSAWAVLRAYGFGQ